MVVRAPGVAASPNQSVASLSRAFCRVRGALAAVGLPSTIRHDLLVDWALRA
jgi:hypothetical protein